MFMKTAALEGRKRKKYPNLVRGAFGEGVGEP